ncbi:hypothetical protein RclHR1_20010002 [Rhizophagus clarus]|uniref:Uncharacterized protein n=1 Tax=Rhizophagus clarus TaxID=94130 RepID=A0A2Z6QQR4_9GLOM|nr:hypothetical protein RclHR1_20010002 [Rhizophagus clarus]
MESSRTERTCKIQATISDSITSAALFTFNNFTHELITRFNTKFFIHTEDKQRKIVTYFKTCKKQLVRLTLPMSEKRDSEDERKIKVPTSRLRRTRRRKISGPNGINEESPCRITMKWRPNLNNIPPK